MLDNPERDADALQREMEEVRSDMVENIERLKLTLRERTNLHRQLVLHPWATLAVVGITGLGVILAGRRYLQSRRIRRTLEQLSSRRRRAWLL